MRGVRSLLLIPVLFAGAVLPSSGADGPFERRRYFYEDIFLPFYAPDAAGKRYSENRPGAAPAAFSMPKSTNTFRVFVVGGSIAQRYMHRESNRQSSLHRGLEAVLGQREIEVLNCGMPGYDSFREAMILEEIIEYAPDLIVLMTGHNETVGSPPVPLWLLHARDRLDKIAAFKSLVGMLQKKRGFVDGALETGPAERDVQFEKNLAEMIRLAGKKKIPFMTVVPPLNMKESPPQVRIPLTDPDFVRGWIQSLRGDFDKALVSLEASRRGARSENGAPSWQHFFMARAYEQRKDFKKARYHYRSALDVPMARRCSGKCPDAIRRVSHAEGAALVELDRDFEAIAPGNLPDLRIFNDALHWSWDYNDFVSDRLIARIKRVPALRELPWRDPPGPKWRPPQSVSKVDTLATLRYAAKMMGDSPMLEWTALVYLDVAGRRMPKALKSAKEFRKRVLESGEMHTNVWGLGNLNLSDARLTWYLAELALYRGEFKRAVRLYTQALKHAEIPREAHYGRAAAAALAGNAERANESLDALAASGNEMPASILREALAR